MDERLRRGPSISMFLALFCFILPFATLSCPGESIRLNGVELAVGTTIEQAQPFGEPTKQKTNAEPLAACALALTFLAALVSVPLSRGPRIATGLLGAVNLLLLVLMKVRVEHEVLTQGQGMLQVSWAFGFWLALLSHAATVALVILGLQQFSDAGAAREAGWISPGSQRAP